MALAGRRVTKGDEGLSVATPEAWRGSLELRDRYDALTFDRFMRSDNSLAKLVGVGHPLLDRAISDSMEQQVFLSRARGISAPLLVAQVEDEITGTGATVHRIVVGIEGTGDAATVLRDWELLVRLNEMTPAENATLLATPIERSVLDVLCRKLAADVVVSDLPFRRPKLRRIIALFPEELSVD